MFQAPRIPGKLLKFHSPTDVLSLQPVFMYLNRGGSRILETGVQNLRVKPELRERIKHPRIDGEAREKAWEGSGEGAR